jgi:ABC-type xylose transport system, permease component
MTMVILSGGIDLSVGSVLALAGAAAGLLKGPLPLLLWNLGLEFTVGGAMLAGVMWASPLGGGMAC